MRTRVTTVLLAALVVLISTGTAWWAGGRAPTIRGAVTEIVVPVGGAGGTVEAGRLLAAERRVLDARVVGAAARRLDMSPRDLRRRLDASIVDNRARIRIEAWARSGARATEILDVVVPTYLDDFDRERVPSGRPTVFTPPRELEEPLAPKPRRSAALGAVVGLALAAVLVMWSLRRGATRPELTHPS